LKHIVIESCEYSDLMVDLTSSACLIVTQHILLPCYYFANIFGGEGISLLTRINFINSNVSKRIGYQSNFAPPGGGNAMPYHNTKGIAATIDMLALLFKTN
jgi:hypothetical protein